MRATTESRRPSRWWTAGLTAITVLMSGTSAVRAGAGETCPPPPPPAPDCSNPGAANTHAARAYSIGLDAAVLGIGVDLGPVPDTGQIPSDGGDKDATLVAAEGQGQLPIPLPKRLSLGAKILHNTAFGSGDTSNAYSSVTDLNLGIVNVLTNTSILSVSAGLLTAKATVKCKAHVRTVDAARTGSSIAKLAIKILGVPIVIPANAPANTKIALPAALKLLAKGGIVLNEQATINGRQVVNALHINLEVLGLLNAAKVDLIVSHAEANITCGSGSNPDSCTCKDREYITGTGTITGVNRPTASFSFVGKAGTDGPAASLHLVDGTDEVTGGAQTSYNITGERARSLVFNCSSGPYGICQADVADNGTPGANKDTFGLDVIGTEGSEYPFKNILDGEIELFTPNCGTAN